MSQSQENLRAVGRRDRQTLFYRILPAEARDPRTSFQHVTGGEYTKSCLKENAKIFSKHSTTQENITILRLKKTKKKTYTKEKTSNQKLNQ